jgi:parvulin-like peptidyl-prolyl isomerase
VGIALAAGLTACSSPQPPKEPDRIRVQHILIAFQGSMGPSKTISRSQADAERLAKELIQKAQAGEEFGSLVQTYTDERAPGIYGLTNDFVPLTEGFLPRRVLMEGFGDVAFGLAVGEIGLCSYDPTRSPLGWHIIKRLE